MDEFYIASLDTVSGQIAGGLGNDKLFAPDEDNTWTLTGTNTGTLNDTDFSSVEALTGETLDDTMKRS